MVFCFFNYLSRCRGRGLSTTVRLFHHDSRIAGLNCVSCACACGGGCELCLPGGLRRSTWTVSLSLLCKTVCLDPCHTPQWRVQALPAVCFECSPFRFVVCFECSSVRFVKVKIIRMGSSVWALKISPSAQTSILVNCAYHCSSKWVSF